MTQVSLSDAKNLAAMSSLALSDDEAEHLRSDLENILTHVDALSQLDTDEVEPTYQVTGLENIYRDDVVQPGLSGEALVALAPDAQQNQIKVPKVL